MNKTFGLLAILATTTAHAGFDYSLRVNSDAFILEINQTYPLGITIEQVREAYSDPGLTPEVSNLVVGMKRIPLVAPGAFRLETDAKKFGITLTAVNLCSETTTATTWTQKCRLDPSSTVNKMLFVGASGSSWNTCAVTPSETVSCRFHVEGRPKAMHFPISRSVAQLSAGGSGETTHDVLSVYTVITTKKPPKAAKAAAEASFVGQSLSNRMYDDIVRLRDSAPGKTAIVTVKDNGTYTAVSQ